MNRIRFTLLEYKMLPTLICFWSNQNMIQHQLQNVFAQEVKKSFGSDNLDLNKIAFFNGFLDIFHLRVEQEDEKRFVSNISINKSKYYSPGFVYNVIEIYSLYTNPYYRKKKFARQIIYRSVNKIINTFKIINPILALHLNTEDEYMSIVYSFYLNLGFHTFCYVNMGPDDMKFSMDDQENFFDWTDVLNRKVNGKHLAMFAFQGFNKKVKGNFVETGEKIRQNIIAYIKEQEKSSENNVFEKNTD